MKILFKGSVPQEKSYSYSVKNNNNSNVITFELDKIQEDDLDLSSLTCFVKVKGAIIDKDVVTKVVEDDKLKIKWIMKRKHTKSRIISVQLQFEGYGESDIVWQTEMIEITLSNTINADEYIENEYPGELADHEERIQALEQGITKDTYSREVIDQKIHESEEEMREEIHQSKDIIVGNPDAYISESGVDKIIRKREKDGSIVQSYVVDKIVYPSTLVKCEQHREDNGFYYDDQPGLIPEDFGSENWIDIFGEDNIFLLENIDELSADACTCLYYNHNGEITKGIVIGKPDKNYVGFSFDNCIPNKEITIVVGKYFEYDEQGNKIFDEDEANFYCKQVVGEEGDWHPITEERQEFKVKIDSYGSLYFDCDASHDGSRFILYEIRAGEPEHIEYKKKLIGSDAGSGSNKFIELELEKGEIIDGSYYFYDDEYKSAVLLHDLHIKLHNFTQEDAGKYIYMYRRTLYNRSSVRAKKFIHPVNWDSKVTNIQKFGYACQANTPYKKNVPEGEEVKYRPSVPDWMPNNGAIRTEIQITREDINRGYINFELSKELIPTMIGYIEDNPDILDFDLRSNNLVRCIGNDVKIKFGIVDDGKLIYLSNQILRILYGHMNNNAYLGNTLIRLPNGEIRINNTTHDSNKVTINVGII